MISRGGLQVIIFVVSMGLGMSAGSAQADDSSSWRQCTNEVEPEFEFIKAIGQATEDRRQALTTLDIACNDLDSWDSYFTSESKLLQLANSAFYHTTLGLIGIAFGDVAGIRSDNTYLIQYENTLQSIKSNSNRYERVRDAYLHAITHQGEYANTISTILAEAAADAEEKQERKSLRRFVRDIFKATWEQVKSSQNPLREILDIWDVRPRRTLTKAQESGFGGICRHFATLLYYNLMSTSRTTGDHDMHLGETAYSSTIVGSVVHVWNRVNIPHQQANGTIKFYSFELDPTKYTQGYVPLYPRRAWDKAGNLRARTACQKVYNCLIKKAKGP